MRRSWRRGDIPGARAVPMTQAVREDAGMVTAELAVTMFAIIAVMLLMLGVAGISVAHSRTVEAARAGARAAARGDSDASIRAAASRAAPGADIRISRSGSEVEVSISTQATLPLPGADLGLVTVSASSVAEPERS